MSTNNHGHLPLMLFCRILVFLVPFLAVGCAEQKKPDYNALREGLQSMLQLQTAEYVYRDVIYQGKEDKVLGLVTTGDTRLLFAVNFNVRAGVDLSKGIELSPIEGLNSQQEPAILVKLPPAEILSIDADESSIEQLFAYEMPSTERYYLFGKDRRIEWLDVQGEVEKAKDRVRADAINRGVQDRAWKNVSTLITNFLRLSGIKTVRIEASALDADAPTPEASAGAVSGAKNP